MNAEELIRIMAAQGMSLTTDQIVTLVKILEDFDRQVKEFSISGGGIAPIFP